MSEISLSHGTLFATLIDPSTPSNNSQYFSVASSLDVLDGRDEVYYSMENGIDKEIPTEHFSHTRKYECNKIIPEYNNETINVGLSNSLETMPHIIIHESSVDVEDWDKVCDSLNSFISQESVSTDDSGDGDDEEGKNFSVVTDSFIHYAIKDRHSSDGNAVATVSLNNSIIEGELSDLIDIVYESFDSPDFCINDNDKSSKLEEDDDSENGEQKIYDQEVAIVEMCNEIEIPVLNEVPNLEPEVTLTRIDDDLPNSIEKRESRGEIKSIEDSPAKRSSFLCCTIKRKKTKRPSSMTNSQMSKTKRLLQHFIFFKTKQVEKIVSEINISAQEENICVVPMQDEDFDDIPFIDEDGEISLEATIPLAKNEVFCD